ncbi:LysR family transcriptional regulator [Vibrio ulleungensis]|uniref:LysR family transcriptional regulator n=1 Tax=Vibrio ulleungensis TaxID=2807619 RepID=A0ABS2HHQ7_9VIBR|nr:LysR family transcriptional regulator [Vibrio ulleungensis]MBM7035341.1 LysR family transcriptional regulator [Vibrio ulleungensis]
MPRASFDQLSAFVSVAEHGSFSKAARKLNKDRSTLHRQVTDLEIDWGIELFERNKKAPKLTEQGESLVRAAKLIIYQMNALESATDSLHLGDKTQITICHDSSISSLAIQKMDAAIRSNHPMTVINWLSRSRKTALELLVKGQADFCITLNQGALHPDSGVSFINLGYPEFKYYAHQSSPLASEKQLSLPELQLHRQFLLEDLEQSLFGQQTLISSQTSSVSDPMALIKLLELEGFSLLPTYLVEQDHKQLVPLDLDFALQSGRLGYVLLYPSSAVKKTLQQDIIDVVGDWFRESCA